MAAMSAAENKFPDPPSDRPGWLGLAQAVFNTLYADKTLRLERGPSWTTDKSWDEVLDSVRTLAGDPESAAGLVAAAAPAEEEEVGLLAPTVAAWIMKRAGALEPVPLPVVPPKPHHA